MEWLLSEGLALSHHEQGEKEKGIRSLDDKNGERNFVSLFVCWFNLRCER